MQPEEQAENNAELAAPAKPFPAGTQCSFKATDLQINATFLPASLSTPLAPSMPNDSFFKGTQDCPQTQKSQSTTGILVSQHVRATSATESCWWDRGAWAKSPAGRGTSFILLLGPQMTRLLVVVLPEMLMLAHVRGWVALEWVDAGSGSRLFLLIIIYITVIPSPSSFCSPRLWLCAISGGWGVTKLIGGGGLCVSRAHSIFFS